MTQNQENNRRPLKSRGSIWSNFLLKLLIKTPITPNQVSVASVGFACLGALGFVYSGNDHSWIALLRAVIGMQGRLLCNLMDGMIALEGKRATSLGELYNEIPDRISDIIILLGAGYGYRSFVVLSVSGMTLGWSVALLALLTAYVRVFGASLGAGQIFLGPMAKPHRMALLTCACLLEIALILFAIWQPIIPLALAFMIVGCLLTLYRRMRNIIFFLSGN